jgi:hypothetical protein
MAIEFSVGMNEKPAVAAAKNLTKSLDGIDKTLDDLANSDFGGDIDRELDKVSKSADKTGKDIKRELSGGFKEAGDEARQSGREAAASFGGGFEDVGDFLQETAANAFGGFGPIGMAAGIAGAAGIGLVTAELVKQQEAIEAMKQRYSDMYQAAAEEGLNYIGVAQVIANTNDLMFNTDRANEWKSVQEDAIKIGIDANTLALARNGHEESLATVLQATADAQEKLKTSTEERGTTAIRLSIDEQNQLRQIQNEYLMIQDVQNQNQENLKNANAINAGLHEAERSQIQRTRDADQARYEALAANAQRGVTIPVTVDTGDAYRTIEQLRAAASRSVSFHVGASGVNQVQ